jgi:DNA-binding transcriptional LysR family regulator
MVQITQLKYLQKIAELKSMNKASAALFVSQSNLSYAMKQLEDELNLEILVRTNKGVALTEAGEELLQYADNVLKQMELIENMGTQKEKQILSISGYWSVAYTSAICEFLKNNKKNFSEIVLEGARIDNVMRNIERGHMHVGLIHFTQYQRHIIKRKLKNMNLTYEQLCKDTWYACVGPNNPLYNRKSVHAEELMPFPFIRAKDDFVASIGVANTVIGDVRLADFPKEIFCNDSMTGLRLMQDTDAFRFTPGCSCADYEKNGLHTMPIEENDVVVSIGWIHRKDKTVSKLEQEFISYLKEYFRKIEMRNAKNDL